MPSPRRTAVSYSRFSCPQQAAGDSADRQERLYRAFCERHNLTPGKEVFADRGASSYRGKHREKGRLGQLIQAAKDGQFDPGTVVVIEAWDRLGRMRPDRQTELVAELLKTGVSIGVCGLNDIFTEDDFGSHKWTMLAVFVQLAHQESKQKSERVAASWEQRRKRARESGSLIRSRVPAWIEVVGGKPRLVPERAATIKKIFTWAADGLGHTRIVRKLEEEKVPAFGEKIIRAERTRSQFSGKWSKPYVALLLRDRRVLGELQPMKAEKPDGAPLVDYYPAVITEELFALARAAQESRLTYDKEGKVARDAKGRRSASRESKHVNVFRGLLTHARDGEGFALHNKGVGKAGGLSLITASGAEGRSERSYLFPYHVFEEAILGLLKEVDPASVLPQTSGEPSWVDTLRAKLANLRTDLASIKADLGKGYSKALADVLRSTETAEEVAANELQDELARVAKPLSRTWEELPTLIDAIKNAEDPDAVRLRLRPALRAAVQSAALLIVPYRSWRYAVVQFHFAGGVRRDWIIAHQSAANQRPGGWFTRSFADVGLSDTDLLKPGVAERFEKLILKHAAK